MFQNISMISAGIGAGTLTLSHILLLSSAGHDWDILDLTCVLMRWFVDLDSLSSITVA